MTLRGQSSVPGGRASCEFDDSKVLPGTHQFLCASKIRFGEIPGAPDAEVKQRSFSLVKAFASEKHHGSALKLFIGAVSMLILGQSERPSWLN